MKKKTVYIVGGDSGLQQSVSPKKRIVCPTSGTPCFATFPGVTRSNLCGGFPPGDIELHYGLHRGAHSGYGLVHIWQEHYSHHATVENAEPEIVGFILSVLVPGASIHYEGGLGRHDDRTMVFRAKTGIVIVELGTDARNNPQYSIVTAYPNGYAKGPLVGAF